MTRDFAQIAWDPVLADDLRQLIRLAVREDLDRYFDVTTLALVPEEAVGRASVVARGLGVAAGLVAIPTLLEEMETQIAWQPLCDDGALVQAGQAIAELQGPARDLLTAERPLLNLLGRLSGIATAARRFVDAIAGTRAHIYDTRKTTPGWRRLEKYAVRCGGGRNHRTGLFDGVLIKDNHLAWCASQAATPSQAVVRARQFVADLAQDDPRAKSILIEVEVDTLEQLDDVLAAAPDIVLLDNMPPEILCEAVARRNGVAPQIELEASGGIQLATVRAIAETGVERISIGALTHSVSCLDIGLDWNPER